MRGVGLFMLGILVGFALGAPIALLASRRAQGQAQRAGAMLPCPLNPDPAKPFPNSQARSPQSYPQ